MRARFQYFGLLGFLIVSIVSKPAVESRGIHGRIVSGRPAKLGQFPWQVILKKDEIDDLLCGGSIISNTWVLTAAHCTSGLSSIFLMFGTIILEDTNALSMTASQLYVHPKYNSANLNNDVSLIQLPQSLTFTNNIQPIKLVPSSQSGKDFQGVVATIAGFGLIDDEYLEYSQTLQYAEVLIIPNPKCVDVYGKEVVISSTICATGNNGTNMSICSGDSGGPLIVPDSNGNYMQIGINSFVAQDMCTEKLPSGYARLTSFLDYIKEITGLSFS